MTQGGREFQRPADDAGDRDVTRSRALDVPGGHQGVLHAGRAPFSIRRPAMSDRFHLVDVSRLQTQRHVQRVGTANHLLHAQQPGPSHATVTEAIE